MLVQTIIAARLKTSQLGGSLVVNFLGVEPRFRLLKKTKRNCDTNLSEASRNSAVYGFYSGLPVPIAGQINFEVEVTVADCKELGIPSV